MNKQVEFNLNFGGFYESIHSCMIDDSIANYYDKDIEGFNNKDEDNKYTSLHSIPKYHVYKDKVKLGPVLTRKTFEDKPFLFIPKTYKKGGKLAITKDYYIYDVDEEYKINEKATLIFYQ